MEWTKEYCGVYHLGTFSPQETWLTVVRHNNSATLLEWYPGCKFSPKETPYNSVEDAMRAGESILAQH